jgi:hypothetical protein
MRVVLKPAGVVAALVVMGYMVFTILTYTKESQSPDAFRKPTPTPPTAMPERQLSNGSFEKPFSAARVYGNPPDSKAKLSGELASGWEDNSTEAATSAYAPDTHNPHTGETSQRIELRSVAKKGEGAQICQVVAARRGRVYTASAWVRAKANTEVMLTLRPLGENLRVKEASRRLTVGTGWKQVSVEMDARDMMPETADALLIVGVYTPKTTLWVDDVAFGETKKNSATIR